ncbi:MAG: TRAP transporter large permease subunit [Bacillota bacterium]
MEWWLILLLIIGVFLVLVSIGLPVAFTFMAINLLGVYILWGGTSGFLQLVQSIYSSVILFSLLPVPLFVLMGEIMFQSGVGVRMIEALDKWIGRVPGRLSLLAIAGGTVFSALSGSAMASAAMLGSVLVPEMRKRGYQNAMSIGPIVGSGGLAIMIPPSALAVLLATLARISIGDFLMAIIFPGILMAFLYTTYVVVRCYLQPHLAPSYNVEAVSLLEKIVSTVKYILPLGLVIFLVIGLIILGVATPTESAALGTLGCIVLAIAYGGFNRKTFISSMNGTLRVTVMMFMILTGSTAFSQILAFSGATRALVGLVIDLPLSPLLLLICMQLILLIMGAFMEPLSIMMITLPIYMPAATALGFHPLWFAAVILLNMQMATTTPPFGMVLFVMKGVLPKETKMGEIYKSGIPFLFCDTVSMTLMFLFPSIVLWLPMAIKG